MVGFGPEDDHFVAELTYNYGVGEYRLGNDFLKVSLAVSDLQRSVHYWSALLGMKVIEKNEDKKIALMGFSDNQLPDIEALKKKEKQKILTPLVRLDTPGKATVEVVILADPDQVNPVIHFQTAFMCILCGCFHRPWLQIRVTSGLPNRMFSQHVFLLLYISVVRK
ncbi:hypothetical protein cypCar_00011922 [Cyprinus carpio]|nr:hypothetical protein cypCar_00011922 [Cyprinus carpio]